MPEMKDEQLREELEKHKERIRERIRSAIGQGSDTESSPGIMTNDPEIKAILEKMRLKAEAEVKRKVEHWEVRINDDAFCDPEQVHLEHGSERVSRNPRDQSDGGTG